MYQIRDKEAGNVIDSFINLHTAKLNLLNYEEIDKKEGNYTKDFYEIYDTDKEQIINI